MPPRKIPIEPVPTDLYPQQAHELFANRLSELLDTGWSYLPDTQLDENFAEWQAAAAARPLSSAEKSWAETAMAGLRLDHATHEAHIPDTIARSEITTHAYRLKHPALIPHDLVGLNAAGNQTPYEEVLGLNDFVCFSFADHSPMRAKYHTVFKVPALAMLERPGTLVFPFDAPFAGAAYSLEENVARNQAMALRGTDYMQLLPTYLAAERSGRQASELYPAWLSRSLYLPKSFQQAEIKVLGNLALDEVDWQLEVRGLSAQYEALTRQVDPAIVASRFIDKSMSL